MSPEILHVSEAMPATFAELAAKINTEHAAVEASARAGLAHAKAAGEMLAAAKRQIGHGRWLAWVKEHCRVSERTCRAYMQIADRWEELTAKRQHAADLSIRDGLRLLVEADASADLAAQLTGEGRLAYTHGMIDEAAARQLLRLNVLNKVATKQCDVFPNGSWADRAAKFVLWRPHFARTEAEVAAAVDWSMMDLFAMRTDFADLSPEEAEQACAEAMRDPERQAGTVSPTYFYAWLWREMAPDFSRLSAEEWDAVVAGAQRYIDAIPVEAA
jgi:hypothetical protein